MVRGRVRPTADVDPPGVGSIAGVVSRPEGGTDGWVGYTDYATPPSVYRWDGSSTTPALTEEERAPVAGQVPSVTVVETHATSKDGTPVHLFVLSQAGEPDRKSVV